MRGTFLLLDDHPLYRMGIRTLIHQELGLDCFGEASTVAEGRELLSKGKPDIAIVDLSLQDEDGLSFVKECRTLCPGMGVLVVSMHDENLYGERAIKAGARGYVMKHEEPNVLIGAIRTILSGGLGVSDNLRERLAERWASGLSVDPAAALTEREFEIFTLLGKGYGASDIAERLHLSVKTVHTHQERIKGKLGLSSAGELRRFAATWNSRK